VVTDKYQQAYVWPVGDERPAAEGRARLSLRPRQPEHDRDRDSGQGDADRARIRLVRADERPD
jgi:hypothetical protein